MARDKNNFVWFSSMEKRAINSQHTSNLKTRKARAFAQVISEPFMNVTTVYTCLPRYTIRDA